MKRVSEGSRTPHAPTGTVEESQSDGGETGTDDGILQGENGAGTISDPPARRPPRIRPTRDARQIALRKQSQDFWRGVRLWDRLAIGGTDHQRTGYIYAVGSVDGIVKVGRATELGSRLSAIRTSSPVPVWLLRAWHVARVADTERRLLRVLNPHRRVGEWFDLSGSLELIRQGLDPILAPSWRMDDEGQDCDECGELTRPSALVPCNCGEDWCADFYCEPCWRMYRAEAALDMQDGV